MINWLERLAWRLMHRHQWYPLSLAEDKGPKIDFYMRQPRTAVRQGCRVMGCGARRIRYDDGSRISKAVAAELVWIPVDLKATPNHVVSRQPLHVFPSSGAADDPPRSMRSQAIHRLDRAASKLKGLVDDDG